MISISKYKRTDNDLKSQMSGIYCITNLINGKKYIGQTYDIQYRWRRHKCDLKNRKHSNRHLQNAWNKYGKDNFSFSVLEYCSVDQLDKKEIYWIDYYNTINNGYNIAEGGLGCRGYKHTDKEIKKMRDLHNVKSVAQLDKDFNIIKIWESASQVAKQLHLYHRSVIDCCERKNYVKSLKGYIWVYYTDINNIDKEYYLVKNIKNPKRVGMFDIDLNLMKTWNSVYDAQKDGYDGGCICAVCNHKRNFYKNYIWAYIDNNNNIIDNYDYIKIKSQYRNFSKICKCSLDGNILCTYESLSEAARINHIDKHKISSCCKGKIPSINNTVWKYV